VLMDWSRSCSDADAGAPSFLWASALPVREHGGRLVRGALACRGSRSRTSADLLAGRWQRRGCRKQARDQYGREAAADGECAAGIWSGSARRAAKSRKACGYDGMDLYSWN
jgi:hypothetical protein